MNKETYKNIKGIDEFFKYFPEVHWCHFHEVIEFKWYREFDCEEWSDSFSINLIMSDMSGKDTILLKFKNVSGECNCNFCGWISGLEIVNLKYMDRNREIRYEILDFEDSQIHFYCADIEVKVLCVNGGKTNFE